MSTEFFSDEDMDAMYLEVMRDADKEEAKRQRKNRVGLKSVRRFLTVPFKQLKDFLNEHDGWDFHGIVNVYKTDEKRPGYPSAQCYRIKNDPDRHLYQYTDKGWDRPFHYLIIQWSSGEDSYYGYLLIPLKDGRYFKISYAC